MIATNLLHRCGVALVGRVLVAISNFPTRQMQMERHDFSDAQEHDPQSPTKTLSPSHGPNPLAVTLANPYMFLSQPSHV